MTAEDGRCTEARKLQRIDQAFRTGDLDGLRAALDNPDAVPNGRMPATIGHCLVYAIYHSPLAFIRILLELGADPNAAGDDGFPSLIAALSCTRDVPGSRRRTDVEDILRLLLSFGTDPNQRGINDYTPLHMAVAERNPAAVQILLEAGADPELRTRIDECATPLEMAQAAASTRMSASSSWARGTASSACRRSAVESTTSCRYNVSPCAANGPAGSRSSIATLSAAPAPGGPMVTAASERAQKA